MEQKTLLSLGQQAVSLRDSHDRLKALRRVTSTAQILLAYSMVMRALSQTASRYVCLPEWDQRSSYNLLALVCFNFFFFPICSTSASSQSNGLESLGLADIRILVRLMTLAVAGRAHSCADRQPGLKGATAAAVADRNNSSCLSFLSSAIGSVVSHSPAAYRQLVEICTQVCHSTADPLMQRIVHAK